MTARNSDKTGSQHSRASVQTLRHAGWVAQRPGSTAPVRLRTPRFRALDRSCGLGVRGKQTGVNWGIAGESTFSKPELIDDQIFVRRQTAGPSGFGRVFGGVSP